MLSHSYGNKRAPRLILLPGLGVSFEIFLPPVELLREEFYIITIEAADSCARKICRKTNTINDNMSLSDFIDLLN